MRQELFRQDDPSGQWAGPAFIARLLRLALIGLPLVIGVATSQAQTTASLPEARQLGEKGNSAKPILAWTKFCEQFAEECTVDPSEPAVVQLTSQTWNTIVSVNRRVNTRIKPITDKEHWGLVDRWEFPDDGSGDCEDFQLLKRRLLAEAGLPRRAMRMTVVLDDKREGHAVLMIRTDRGDYVLDNKTSQILPWHQTGYIYVKRESQTVVGWVSLGGATSPVVTANR